MEEWRDIEGYEGLYQVSNEGRIKSLEKVVDCKHRSPMHCTEKILNGSGKRYKIVYLYKDGVSETCQVHKLVAEAFIPNPNGYTVVHHLNHDKRDNRAENLAWMSDKEHRGSHAIEQNSKKVYQYTLDGELAKTWNSVADALRNGYCNISRCCCGKSKTANGYRWSYTPL